MWQPGEAGVLVQDHMQHEWSLVITACERRLRPLRRSPERNRRHEKGETGQGDNARQVLAEDPTNSSHERHRDNLLSRTEPVELGIEGKGDRKRNRQNAECRPLRCRRNHQREPSCYSEAERNFRVEKRVLVTIEEDDERCQQQQPERRCVEDERSCAGGVGLALGGHWRQGREDLGVA